MLDVTPLQVFDYREGQKITRPGVYRDVPMAVYHSQCCDGPSISSSGVRMIEDPDSSLLHFYDQSEFNPDRPEEEPKHYFSLGRALHHLAGGDGNFLDHFAVRPDEWDSWRTKDAKAWRARMELARRDVLVPADLDLIRGMAQRLGAHPTIQAGILTGLVEHSIFWKRAVRLPDGRVVTIWLKSRPDVLPIHSNMIVDLKTTADASPKAVRRSIGDFGYHIQLAMAQEGLLATTRRRMTDFVLVFIETKRPFAINHKPLSAVSIEMGRRQLKRGLTKFAQAIADNDWPGYDDDEVECGLPDWYAKRLDYEAQHGMLPGLDESDEPAPEPEEAV